MYSGSDSNESQKYAQWALNPASFQNVPGEQVDWAALAQQWIIMKEAGPPPMPGDQPILQKRKKSSTEGGEAEMDVENDKEAPPPPVWSSNEAPPPPGIEAWNWSSQNQSWNWSNNWVPPVPPPAPSISGVKAPLLPTPNNSYTETIESTNDNAIPFGSHHTNSNSSNYWNNTSASSTKHIKPHNKRYSKVNVPIRAPAPIAPSTIPVESTPVSGTTLDTAKRKQLPAWIREGLEKMEKDKLKQMEKQKEKDERDLFLEKSKPNKETIEILKSTIKERQKSRFESDGENSDEDTKVKKQQKSPETTRLSHDELMLKVRHTMTEVLLNVTNRHIETVCREELQRFIKNQKASEAVSAPSGATIRSRLGLGIYGGDDSGSSSDDENYEDFSRKSRDSDDDLKEAIKRKMTDFQKTEREIEDRLENVERRKGIGGASRTHSPESNDNESQVDARDKERKYYEHDTRQLSSPKPYEKQKARSPSSSSQDSDYSNNKSKTSRRSSSDESKDSYKRSKKRSPTPEKRYRTMSSRWSKSPPRRDSNGSRRDSGSKSKKKSLTKRSRSRSYSRSQRSRSSSYKRSKRRTCSRDKSRRSRSSSRSRYSRRSPSSSRSDRRRRRRRSRSESSSRGKRSHRH